MIPAATPVTYAGKTYPEWTFLRNDGQALERGRYAAEVTLVRCRVLADGTTEHLPPGVPLPAGAERTVTLPVPDINAPVGTDFGGGLVWGAELSALALAWQAASLQLAAAVAARKGLL
jgi:hypothetical protein